QAIREGVIGIHVVHLRGGLVVPGAPALAAVHGDDCALIAGEDDDAGIVGIDPDVLVVVAAGSAAEAGPGLAAVSGFPGDGAGHVNDVRIFGIDAGLREIAAADAACGTSVTGGDSPVRAAIVRAIKLDAIFGGHGSKEPLRIAGGDGE